VRTPEQRKLLDEVRKVAKTGSLIPAEKKYIDQLNIYRAQCRKAGLSKMHGLRHAYAQRRYAELTGRQAPVAGGPSRKELSPADRKDDDRARLQIAQELGHGRMAIVAVYCGS